MKMFTRISSALLSLVCAGTLLSAQPFDSAQGGGAHQQQQPQAPQQQPPPQDPTSFKFRTGVELINVNATVTDQGGRFVSGLTREDFRVYDDEQMQTVTHFSAERVPVSLGIVVDTSGSMDGEKIRAAREALERFLSQLLDVDDEVFLFRFDNAPQLVQGWTRDKRVVSDAVYRLQPRGGTALYDAVADAVQMAQQGHNRKKAIVIISDGNDTSSRTDVFAVKQLIRETEVLVYAIGVDTAPQTPVRDDNAPASFQWSRPSLMSGGQRGQPRVPGDRAAPSATPGTSPTTGSASRGGNSPSSSGGTDANGDQGLDKMPETNRSKIPLDKQNKPENGK